MLGRILWETSDLDGIRKRCFLIYCGHSKTSKAFFVDGFLCAHPNIIDIPTIVLELRSKVQCPEYSIVCCSFLSKGVKVKCVFLSI